MIFQSLTAENAIIEEKTQGLELVNTETGYIDPTVTEVLPSYMEKDSYANYTFSFIPKNFEQNMKIYIKLP
jgi:hypothetical protein